MADAKQCDITGEVYSLDQHEAQEFRIYKHDPEATLDIGPKTYEKILKILQPKKCKQNKAQHTKEFKERQRYRMKTVQARAKELMLKDNMSWKLAQRQAHKEYRQQKLDPDNQQMRKWKKESDPRTETQPCMGCGEQHNNKGDFCNECKEQIPEAMSHGDIND